MGYRIVALAGVLGIVAATALGAATPVTPPPGAFIKTPVFNWTLPANEESDALTIADRPDTTAGGMFVAGNVVRTHSFVNDETTWSPSAPLYAGRYWWLVSSHDRTTSELHYSAPRDFRIELRFEFDRRPDHRSRSHHWLRITVRWEGNMHSVRFKLSLLHRGQIIWSRSGLRRNHLGSPGSVSFTWHRPDGIKQGSVLHVREGFSVPDTTAGAGDAYGVRAP
jgi:hypothetical protein